MYRLTIKGTEFTVPKENIRLLAFAKATDLGVPVAFTTEEQAVEFLRKLGIKVEDDIESEEENERNRKDDAKC